MRHPVRLRLPHRAFRHPPQKVVRHISLLPFRFYLYIVPRMFKKLLGALWQLAPTSLRRWGVCLVEPRFTVTAGAVVTDDQGRVLVLEHRFRAGSGWGI